MAIDPASPTAREHWETVWRTKPATEVSWFQQSAEPCLTLVRRVTAPITSSASTPRVLTVGAGASPLVGALLRTGHQMIAVDIAQAALDALVGELDETAAALAEAHLTLVVADVRLLHIDEPVDVWHDRAVFHFLVDPDDQVAYVHAATTAVASGGHLVIATFAPSGPSSCSGLPVARHDAASLAAAFAPGFEPVVSFEADHHTPWASAQRFTHAVFRRV